MWTLTWTKKPSTTSRTDKMPLN